MKSGKKSLPISKAEKGIFESIENVRLLGQFDTGYQSGETIFHRTGQKGEGIGVTCSGQVKKCIVMFALGRYM